MSHRARAVVGLLILVTLIRVAVTLRTFSVTVDESTHIGAGLELYQNHTYRLHPQNPPLPRVIFAAIPYAIGMRIDLHREIFSKLLSVFFTDTGGKYEKKLFAARVGNLLFLALACVAMWMLARETLGERGPFVALLLFITQPIVLGYSGLATHDIAAAAMTGLSLVAFLRWLRMRGVRSASLVGVAYGVSVLCKFSCIAFVPAACAVIYAVRLIDRRATLARVYTLLVAIPVTAVVIWAGYGFSVRPVTELGAFAGSFGPQVTAVMQHLDPRTPLPAPDFFIGIGTLQNERGTFMQYLFGRISREGWWWYFPAAIALKTPIPFLLLIVFGAAVTWREKLLRVIYIESMLAAIVMILLAANSHLDLGIRYILPAYVPLTLAAAAAVIATPFRTIGALLVAAQVIISMVAHPDYFPYFNAFAGNDPSRYLVDSNLDWGQDVLRLRSAVRKLHVDHITVLDSGLIDYGYLGFPKWEMAQPDKPRTGWVALGDHPCRMGQAEGGYSWLGGNAYRRIGKSIRLYWIPARR